MFTLPVSLSQIVPRASAALSEAASLRVACPAGPASVKCSATKRSLSAHRVQERMEGECWGSWSQGQKEREIPVSRVWMWERCQIMTPSDELSRESCCLHGAWLIKCFSFYVCSLYLKRNSIECDRASIRENSAQLPALILFMLLSISSSCSKIKWNLSYQSI